MKTPFYLMLFKTQHAQSKKQIESPISTHVGANSVRPWIRFFMSKHSLFCYQSCILRGMAYFFERSFCNGT